MRNRKTLVILALALATALLAVASCTSKSSTAVSGQPLTTGVEAAPAAKMQASVPEGTQRTISVTGTGTASAAPDIAYIQLGVETRSASPVEAADENARRMNQLVAVLRELGIADKDIRTTQYRISLEREYQDGKPTGKIEYLVVNQMQVTVRKLELVGTVLERAIVAEVNTVSGISFGLSDPANLLKEAREKAIADAKERAQQLAAGLGVKLGAPQQISEWSGGAPVREMAMVEAVRAAAPPISGGELEVNVQVSVSFAIE